MVILPHIFAKKLRRKNVELMSRNTELLSKKQGKQKKYKAHLIVNKLSNDLY